MELEVDGQLIQVRPQLVVVAGFTGRDASEVRRHITELAEQGIHPPEKVPSFYLLPASVISQAPVVDVEHERTSGEAEIALIFDGDARYVTLASDHTDRQAETLDIGQAKSNCPKVFARLAWRYEDVVGEWDALQLRSWISEDGERTLYQSGSTRELLDPTALLSHFPQGSPSTFVLLMGTVPVQGGIRGSGYFWSELSDPRLQRSITLDYRVEIVKKPVPSG